MVGPCVQHRSGWVIAAVTGIKLKTQPADLKTRFQNCARTITKLPRPRANQDGQQEV